ncbi:MAG: phosphopyruvate hydratase [Elusimicrobia bacterium]|nr:phosphopyruvate hydratase [Elusimicrobiota bacterium]
MVKIKSLHAREILDSRGFPTVEADVYLEDGSWGRAAVPSGASTGQHEALELRDGGARYLGKGVRKAVDHIHRTIARAVVGASWEDSISLDRKLLSLDATPTKSSLGANAILAVSMAFCRAAAHHLKIPLYLYLRKAYSISDKDFLIPTPLLNIINGGKHADSGLDIQEFMVVPGGGSTFSQAIQMGTEAYHHLKKILQDRGHSIAVGDEGGFAPHLKSHQEALEILTEAISRAGYADKVFLALDAASSEFYKDKKYHFEKRALTATELIGIYAQWVKRYPLKSLEDPLAEDDWSGWAKLTEQLGDRVRLVGDDIFVTNPIRLKRGIQEKVGNAILIKLNQIGTVTETVETVLLARRSGYESIISHRSGETEDAFIADLAVALNVGAIKTGAPCRSERTSKYNQLLRIEEDLGGKAVYAADRFFRRLSIA